MASLGDIGIVFPLFLALSGLVSISSPNRLALDFLQLLIAFINPLIICSWVNTLSGLSGSSGRPSNHCELSLPSCSADGSSNLNFVALLQTLYKTDQN